MGHQARLPQPIADALAARLRRLAIEHGLRRTAKAIGVTRHLFLVAVAGLPLDAEQSASLEAGLRRLDAHRAPGAA